MTIKDEMLDPVATEENMGTLELIPITAITMMVSELSFRDEARFSDEVIRPLSDVIAQQGLNTPVLLQEQGNDEYLCWNGHRRLHAILLNIKEQRVGFDADYRVPALVFPSSTSRRIMSAKAISANTHAEDLTSEGRLEAVSHLHRLGFSQTEIAKLMGTSTATISRDIKLANHPDMLDLVARRFISPTDAAKLLVEADKSKRADELVKAVRKFGEKIERELRAENKRRKAKDMPLLKDSELWPQKKLAADQIRQWKHDLANNIPLQSPRFRFKAGIEEDKNKHFIVQVDPLKRDVSKLSLKERETVVRRLLGLSLDLAPFLKEEGEEQPEATLQNILSDLRERFLTDLSDSDDVEEDDTHGSDIEEDDFDRDDQDEPEQDQEPEEHDDHNDAVSRKLLASPAVKAKRPTQPKANRRPR